MLDLQFVRHHIDEVKENVKNRKAVADVDEILRLDDQRLALVQAIDGQRQELKASSKQKPDAEIIARLRSLGDDIKQQEAQLREVEASLQTAAALLPNMSSPDMPIGQGEADNVELRVWIDGQGYIEEKLLGTNDEVKYRDLLTDQRPASSVQRPDEDPQPRDLATLQPQHHLDIGQNLGIIDMAQAAKTSGTRFGYLLDGAALLENALVQLLSEKLLAHDFMWVDPPLLVKERVLFGTSHFPEGRDQVYQIAKDNIEEGQELFLVGSSEPSLFAFGMDRVFEVDELPLKLFAVTPCFRSEVGSWGKDVRGIKRVHQFTKLEMDVICPPDMSAEIFEELVGYNEWMLQQLGLTYRVISKNTGDCGYLATHKQYDVEVWMPSQQEFMETMTDTNATEFQARRLNIRYEAARQRGGKMANEREYVHTVNDTGGALGRLVAAILDKYQQADGSVIVPEVLRRWVGREVLVPNKLVRLTKS